MKWNRKHPKGTKQPIIMSTSSGFWASHGFLEDDYIPYVNKCKEANIQPLSCEQFYFLSMQDHILSSMPLDNIIHYQKLMIERAKRENKTLYKCILGV